MPLCDRKSYTYAMVEVDGKSYKNLSHITHINDMNGGQNINSHEDPLHLILTHTPALFSFAYLHTLVALDRDIFSHPVLYSYYIAIFLGHLISV